jgi:glycosyltransferase involved in cell wall biosynthesis
LDLHCTASAYGESFPNVIGEAMSCGVPCVATDVGDSRRIIGDAGRIVPPRSPSILADALLELLQMPEEKKRELGQKARARIVDLFSIDNIILDYNSLYEEVLSRKN